MLTLIFNKIFDYGITPSLWRFAFLKPIPKSSLCNTRIPTQYRHISLLSPVGKLFSGVLNNSLTAFADANRLICDEQNGFRVNRSCIDHLYPLTSLIRKRKRKGQSTFVFIDMEKVFDKIDRNLLFYR